eukprot:2732565-Heterocapsa_arctica.AAC.1
MSRFENAPVHATSVLVHADGQLLGVQHLTSPGIIPGWSRGCHHGNVPRLRVLLLLRAELAQSPGVLLQ